MVSGLMGGNFNLPMVQWIYSGAVGPVPVKEVPMGEVQNWIDE